jgi:hypothetical protein
VQSIAGFLKKVDQPSDAEAVFSLDYMKAVGFGAFMMKEQLLIIFKKKKDQLKPPSLNLYGTNGVRACPDSHFSSLRTVL